MPSLPPRPCKCDGCTRLEYVSPKGRRDGRCNPCRLVADKARDPQRHAYTKLKSNAKRRVIFFDLTLDEFRAFCYETDILSGRGRYALSWHVDRIVDALGYTAGNLQKLTNTENLAKEMERRRKRKIYDYELAARRRLSAYESAEHAAEDENLSVYRFAEDAPETELIDAPEAPF